MQLVTAFNFCSVRHKIIAVINSIADITVSNLNKVLREIFVNKEVSSIFCRKLNRNLISVRVTFKKAVTVFLVDINKRGDER